MTRQNFKIIIAYEGTEFFGWQKAEAGPSVQEELERALFRLTGKYVNTEAASRTDRGVHARGQVVCFVLDKEFELKKLNGALNAYLPASIRVQSIETVPLDFHPTIHAKEKTYRYFLCTTSLQIPIYRLHSWHFPYKLDLAAMKNASQDLLGTHDFSSFTGETKEDSIRTLYALDFAPLDYGRLKITLRGDRFLYKMARILTGTLAYIGCGKLAAGCIPEILALRNRTKAGVTAPAHGLCLWNVGYL